MNSTKNRLSPDGELDSRSVRNRALGALVCLGAIVGSFLYAPCVTHGPVLCLSRLTVGLPCPACGLTRSFCAVAQGHFGGAFACHLFGPALFVLFAVAGPLWLVEAIRRRRIVRAPRFFFSTRVAMFFGACLALYHVARLTVMATDGQLLVSAESSLAGRLFLSVVHTFC